MSREERIACRWIISHQTPYSPHIFSSNWSWRGGGGGRGILVGLGRKHLGLTKIPSIFSTQLYTQEYHFVSTIFHSPNYHPNQTHYKCQKLLVHFFILTSLNLCRNWRDHTLFFLSLKSPKEKKCNPFLRFLSFPLFCMFQT